MRYLDAAAVRAALPMGAAITAMEQAFAGDREIPVRAKLGPSLFMPGRVGEITGMKVVSTVPGKPYGIVAVFGADGACLGLLDGPTVTAVRTGAAAGLATRLLARPDTRTLAMLGAGAMAPDLLRAMCEVRPIGDVLIWSRNPEHAERLAARTGGTATTDAGEAAHAADVVCTATPATAPLFEAGVVRPGTHLNAMGAATPEMAEIPPGTLERALVVVEDREAAEAEAGDLIQAGVTPAGTLEDLLTGTLEGRSGPGEVTVFKSVGIASQDIAAALAALQRAELEEIGIQIS
jgi:ornithine cyclodeaminase